MSATASHQMRFLRLPAVIDATGLSKSEIYRRISSGRFPASRGYQDAPKTRFWTSAEIERWQREQVGPDDFDELLR